MASIVIVAAVAAVAAIDKHRKERRERKEIATYEVSDKQCLSRRDRKRAEKIEKETARSQGLKSASKYSKMNLPPSYEDVNKTSHALAS